MDNRNSPAVRIATDSFAQWMGIRLVQAEEDTAIVTLPYTVQLGKGRIHGGAISALVDVAATVAFWSTPLVSTKSRGATVGFTINFLKLAVSTDLTATAKVRRRGNTLCTGNVVVTDNTGEEVAVAVVTYKLQHK